jgi:hypothetical protein
VFHVGLQLRLTASHLGGKKKREIFADERAKLTPHAGWLRIMREPSRSSGGGQFDRPASGADGIFRVRA